MMMNQIKKARRAFSFWSEPEFQTFLTLTISNLELQFSSKLVVPT